MYVGPVLGALPAGKLDAELLESFYARLQRCRELCDGRRRARHQCRPGELFADAAQLATAGRTASWLDQLADEGRLTTDQRVALAVEDGATTLTGLLRRAELAGHDPQQVLADAISSRSLDDARQIINVLHTRISDRVSLDPIGDTFADWTPKVEDPQWQEYLTTLARAADDRRNELGRSVAADPPTWAAEALGMRPASDRSAERIDWENSVASVAAYRELVGHDDAADPIGPSPKPGRSRPMPPGDPHGAHSAAPKPTAPRPKCQPASSECGSAPTTERRPGHLTMSPTSWSARGKRPTSTETMPPCGVPSRLQVSRTTPCPGLIETLRSPLPWRQRSTSERATSPRPTRCARLGTPIPRRHAPLPKGLLPSWRLAGRTSAPNRRPSRPEIGWLPTMPKRAPRILTGQSPASTTSPIRKISVLATSAKFAPPDPSPESAGTSTRDIREAAAEDAKPEGTADRFRQRDVVRVPTADETAESVRRAQRALHELKQRQDADARRVEDDARTEASRRAKDVDQHLDNSQLLVDSPSR